MIFCTRRSWRPPPNDVARNSRTMLLARPRFVTWSLKADVGMTCGGTVKLYFEAHPAADAAWPIAIFGAGHIVQALVPVLLPLACSITVCDSRPEWIDRLPRAPNLRVIRHDNPADIVPALPAHAFILCMTKGHATDRPILQRALAVGLRRIG